MKKALLIAALCLPMSIAIAAPKNASKASSVSSDSGNPFTPERNKAAGNLSTTIVTNNKMANGCKGKGELTEDNIKQSLNTWQNKNKQYLMVHYDYVNGYLGAVKQVGGDDAAKKALADMTKFNNEQANSMVKTMIEKDGAELACKKYFTILSSGAMDIKEGYPDFKVWKGMVEFSKKNSPKQ
ncbi:hypothetical protein NT239_02360 [Chitinibacter sp. SCUT-21]|uniref:hypothetical protein n=1 Tax=Chitinibacter sp. SCUT-21 TaxID=2970891 RepID=UPI0035A6F2A0